MKSLLKIASLALLVFLASCKKDDDSDVNTSDVVGVWNLTGVSCTNGTTSTIVPGTPAFNGTFTVSGKNYNSTVNFKADGTYVSSGSYTAVVTTTLLGSTDVTEADSGVFEGSGTWSISGSTMTVNDGTTTSSSTITDLTASKMVFSVEVNETQDFGGGASSTTKGTYVFTLTK